MPHPEFDYINLILRDGNKNQAIALLETASKNQAKLLGEIALNLQTLPLHRKYASFKHSKLLKRISSNSKSSKEKAAIVATSHRALLKILLLAAPVLKEILS